MDFLLALRIGKLFQLRVPKKIMRFAIRGSVGIELPRQDQGRNLGRKQLIPNQTAT